MVCLRMSRAAVPRWGTAPALLKKLAIGRETWHGQPMIVPPIHAIDLEELAADAATRTLVLRLPKMTEADVQHQGRYVAHLLQASPQSDPSANPQLVCEVLARSLIQVGHELGTAPQSVLQRLDPNGELPRRPKRCRLMTLSSEGAAENTGAIAEAFNAMGLDELTRASLLFSVAFIAVGSLVTLGRLPLQEVPEQANWN